MSPIRKSEIIFGHHGGNLSHYSSQIMWYVPWTSFPTRPFVLQPKQFWHFKPQTEFLLWYLVLEGQQHIVVLVCCPRKMFIELHSGTDFQQPPKAFFQQAPYGTLAGIVIMNAIFYFVCLILSGVIMLRVIRCMQGTRVWHIDVCPIVWKLSC